jgi:hypothetical protein
VWTCGRFGKDGVLVLKSIADTSFPPLEQQGVPRSLEEFASVRNECNLAAALACSLLRCDAVRDPIGEWGNGCTHAHDHYSYASVLDDKQRTVVVVLPREPMTLTLLGTPQQIVAPTPYSSTSYPATFHAGDDDFTLDPVAPPPEPEFRTCNDNVPNSELVSSCAVVTQSLPVVRQISTPATLSSCAATAQSHPVVSVAGACSTILRRRRRPTDGRSTATRWARHARCSSDSTGRMAALTHWQHDTRLCVACT